ncbi:putative acetyltransferase [Actinacidiphila reveromycinica]|uniref:Putative acetyltransferase n=1 Tax=Actinacidiphila reveromycinica TaxID=659352 RepID=A0A7U3V0L9_9ACTN|nr:GNAT family N-acetyltransferase [Streptomyces sp. SN-593]BBB02150.1 putative acetyltransferase [Streptomyces sp. SN-593]
MTGDPASLAGAYTTESTPAGPVRAGRPEDAAEVVRLRRVMFAAMTGTDAPGPWEGEARRLLAAELAGPDPTTGVFVVDAAGGVGLASCAVGTVERRLPSPSSPAGLFGFVFNVCTDPAHRGRGYARATTEALLDWFAARGVTRVDLHATPEAEHLYRELGFAAHSTALSLDVSARAGARS